MPCHLNCTFTPPIAAFFYCFILLSFTLPANNKLVSFFIFLYINCPFLDENQVEKWTKNRFLLSSSMPPPHTGIALSEKIYTFLTDWGIERKLFSLTLDNASSNDCFVELLKSQLNLKNALLRDGEFFHVRCCAHILNLIV